MTLPVRLGFSTEGRFTQSPPADSARTPAATTVEPEAPPAFALALRALGRQIDAGEKLVQRALAPGAAQHSASDLIALQAGIYRYSEAVDLAAKLIDRASSAVRTTLQTGGQ
jgi:hypothetical protein